MIRETLHHPSTNGSAADGTLARSGKIIMNRHDAPKPEWWKRPTHWTAFVNGAPHLKYVYEETSAATADSYPRASLRRGAHSLTV